MAGQPFDYSINNVLSPFQALGQGMQLGAQAGQMVQEAKARELANQQKMLDMERQQKLNERIQSVISNPNPTARDYTDLAMLMPPEQAKSVRENWSTLNEDAQKNTLAFSGQVLSAFQSGNNEIGINLLNERATAARNAGDEASAKAYETYAKLAEINPKASTASISAMVGMLPGGEKVLEGVFKAQKAPAEIRKGEAEATTAETTAKYADTKALLEIDEIKNDMQVKRINSKIYAMNAALSREANDLKRQELGIRIDEMIKERDTKVREKAAEAESTIATLDNTDSTISRILGSDKLSSALGPIESRLPTVREGVADVEALIETLQSQAFMSQVGTMRGMGALTESEGKKLTASIQSMDRKQSEPQFRKNLSEIQRIMRDAKSRAQKKYGMRSEPTATATTDDPELDALVGKYLQGGQ